MSSQRRPAGGVYGPYETQRDTFGEPLPAAVAALHRSGATRAQVGDIKRNHLHEALDAAGVRLSAYDRGIVDWLACWEPEVVQVVTGWISRANRAT